MPTSVPRNPREGRDRAGGLFSPRGKKVQPAGTARAWQAVGGSLGAYLVGLDWGPGSAQPGDGCRQHASAVHGHDRFGRPRYRLG